MAEPLWQELLRVRLTERNAKESAYSPIIEQCTWLVMHASYRLMNESVRRSKASSTDQATEGEECLVTQSCRKRQSQSK